MNLGLVIQKDFSHPCVIFFLRRKVGNKNDKCYITGSIDSWGIIIFYNISKRKQMKWSPKKAGHHAKLAVDHQCVHLQNVQPLLQCILSLQPLRIPKGVMTHSHPLVHQNKPLVPLILSTVHETIWRTLLTCMGDALLYQAFLCWKSHCSSECLGMLGLMKNEIFILCTDTYNPSSKRKQLEFSLITLLQWKCCLVIC